MQTKSSLNYRVAFIDGLAYCLLIALAVCYSFFTSNFAEINIRPSFLDFPIFIGEFFLAALFVLAFLKCLLIKLRLNKFGKFLVIFSLFILIKSFLGHTQWGPLAFRTAALFYYFFFAVFAYFFYNPDFCASRLVKVATSILVLVVLGLRLCQGFYILSYILIGFSLIFSLISFSKFRTLVVIGFFLLIVNLKIFEAGRGVLLAILFSLSFLIFSISTAFKFSGKFKLALVLLFFVLVGGLGFLSMSQSTRSRNSTLFQIPLIFKRCQELIEKSNYGIRHGDLPRNLWVLLYEKNIPAGLSYEETQLKYPEAYQPLRMYKPAIDPKYLASASLSSPDLVSRSELFDRYGRSVENGKNASISKDMINIQFLSAGTAAWRIMLWYDMLIEIMNEAKNPLLLLFGSDFGKPIRSITLEISYAAVPIQTGWFEPHNSFLNYWYRGGLVGIVLYFSGLHFFWKIWRQSLKRKFIPAFFLLAAIVFWWAFSLTFVIFELPHFAVVVWSMLGFTTAFIRHHTASGKKGSNSLK